MPRLRTFRAAIKGPLPGASGLFQQKLVERLDWIARPDLAAQQRELAVQYLGRGDFVRAAVFAWEALVSRACKGHDARPREIRAAAEKMLDQKLKSDPESPGTEAHRTIRYVRNALAHGTPPENEAVRRILQSPERLRAGLEDAIRCLFD